MAAGVLGDVGPCKITWNGSDIGTYFGKVVFKSAVTHASVKDTQKGTGDVDKVITGYDDCVVDIPMTRVNLAQLATVVPSNSVSGGASGWIKFLADAKVGTSMYENAYALVITRIEDGVSSTDTTPAPKITVFKAYPAHDFEIGFDENEQRIYTVHFYGFPDESNSDRVWAIGG